MSDSLSPPVERRASLLMLSYWEKLRGERPFPTEQEINPDALSQWWDSCFLIQRRDLENVEDYNFTYLGPAIMAAYNGGIEHDTETPIVEPNATALEAPFRALLETGRPQLHEGEFYNLRNMKVKYRQVLLPLGVDGVVDAILGQMGFKMVE